MRDLDRSTSDAAVASAILSLAQGPGITVTAEAIERAGQLECLKRRGCDEVTDYPTAAIGTLRDSGSQHSGLCGGRLLDSLKGRHYPDRR